MISFSCPACQQVLKAPDEGAGCKVNCPKCGQRLLIPNPVKPAEGNKTVLGEPLLVSHDSCTGSKLDWLDDLRAAEADVRSPLVQLLETHRCSCASSQPPSA